MKNMKKLFSLALALVMMMALVVTAGASTNTGLNTGNGGSNTITISNAEKGETYTLYKIFDAKVIEGGVKDGKGITYSLPEGYNDIPDQLKDVFTWNADTKTVEVKANVSDRAVMTAVKNYIEGAKLDSVSVVNNNEGGPVKFVNLKDGYYAVTSTVSEGASVTITSIAPDATVSEKNTKNIDPDPKNSTKKLVNESGTVEEDKSVSVGETVYYMISLQATNWVDKDGKADNGAEYKIYEYTVTDKVQGDFLTGLKIDSIKIVANDADKTVLATINPSENVTGYTIPWVDNWNAINAATDETEKDKLIGAAKHLYSSGCTIQVMYSATVNEKVLDTTADHPAVNQGWISYNGAKDPSGSDIPHEDVYSYYFNLKKVDATNKQGLANAQFELYDAATGGNKIPLVKVPKAGTTEVDYYRVATKAEREAEGFTSAVIVSTTDNVTIKGLAKGIYWLEEIEAPDGYNKLTDRVSVVNKTVGEGADKYDEADFLASNDIVKTVENSTGAELPATGGIGTTIFTVTGAILMIGAAVLFLTKKRTEA